MGKRTKTVYFCDLCSKESVTKLKSCPFCGKDFCDDCELDVSANIDMSDYKYKKTMDYYRRKDLFRMRFDICDECREKTNEIKELVIKAIKGEVHKKEFKVEASD